MNKDDFAHLNQFDRFVQLIPRSGNGDQHVLSHQRQLLALRLQSVKISSFDVQKSGSTASLLLCGSIVLHQCSC